MKRTLYFNNKNYDLVLVDTSSVLKAEFVVFVKRLIPHLRNSGVKINVPQMVMRELRRISNENSSRGYTAKKAIENLNALHIAGFVAFEGNPNTTERADSYIISRVVKGRAQNEKILVVTQDFQLAKDVLNANNMRSTFAPASNALRINPKGELELFDFNRKPVGQKNNELSKVLKKFGL